MQEKSVRTHEDIHMSSAVSQEDLPIVLSHLILTKLLEALPWCISRGLRRPSAHTMSFSRSDESCSRKLLEARSWPGRFENRGYCNREVVIIARYLSRFHDGATLCMNCMHAILLSIMVRNMSFFRSPHSSALYHKPLVRGFETN